MVIIVMFILAVSLYCAVFKPPYFVLIYGVLGCAYDSRGFTGFFSSLFAPYTEIMNILLLLSVVVSVFHLIKIRRINNKTILLALLFLISIMFSFLLGNLAFNWGDNLIYGMIHAACSFGPCVFIVWYSYIYDCPKHKTLFKSFVFIQVTISFLIIYLPEIGVNWLSVIDAANYIPDGITYMLPDRIAKLSNFYQIFTGKGTFFRCAQFHNANPLGLYAGTSILLTLNKLVNGKTRFLKKILGFVFIFFMFLLWCNSGMRGVVYAIILSMILDTLLNNKKTPSGKKAMLVFIAVGVIGLSLSFGVGNIASYLFGENASSSFEIRKDLFFKGLEYGVNHIFIGNGGRLAHLTAAGIDPHQLPIRLWVMYGLPTAILSFALIFILPIKKVFMSKNKSFYSISLILVVWFTALTNNYTSIVLFWIAFAEAIAFEKQSRHYKKRSMHTDFNSNELGRDDE